MIEITEKPIHIEKIREAVADPSCGAVVLFEGRVRNHHDGKSVAGLEYEIYLQMALKIFESLCTQAKQKWLIQKVAVVHRYGRLQIGDLAVVVAVSSAHRREAFEAAQFIMDTLKQEAPIWKKEFYPDEPAQWVHCSHNEKKMGGGLLAGGESRRFGENKALATKNGKPFYQIALDLLERHCAQIRVSANDPQLFNQNKYEVVPDALRGCGPLAGVAGLLKVSSFPWVLILTCDMPQVTDLVVHKLVSELGSKIKLVCFQEEARLHPFPGLFHRDLVDLIESQLAKGCYRAQDLIALIPEENKKIITVRSLSSDFININTKEEYLKL